MIPDLGKYADTVLSSYAVSILLLVLLVAVSIRAARKARIELEQVEGRRNG
ncbi:heme exporter protein CcmD [Shimia sediminis]|uniref:heme exporter protein CcmD n=1 Tax=Shimia sediminis TaxID=2497945 RepID=UPI00197D6C87|nr:heme exporter protein CcmD [Shimia sediminis]